MGTVVKRSFAKSNNQPAWWGEPVAFGSYTPTVTLLVNAAAGTPGAFQWQQNGSGVGSVITVSGFLTLTATAGATDTRFGLSLPVASNLASTGQLAGNGSMGNNANMTHTISIFADVGNARALIRYLSPDTNADATMVIFQYIVV